MIIRVFTCMMLALSLNADSLAVASRAKIVISAPSNQIRLGQPIVIKAVITNDSTQALPLDKSVGHANGELYYSVHVWDSQHKLVPDTAYGESVRKKDFRALSKIQEKLSPGQSMEETINITELFRIDKPGSYTVQVQRTIFIERTLTFRSNRIAIAVLPKE
jgi:hypothetical protein